MVLGPVSAGAVARDLYLAQRRPRARDGAGAARRSRRLEFRLRLSRAPADPPRRHGGARRGARRRARGGGVTYLFWSFAIVWIGLFLYVRALMRRARALEDEVRRLSGSAS